MFSGGNYRNLFYLPIFTAINGTSFHTAGSQYLVTEYYVWEIRKCLLIYCECRLKH